MSKPLPRPQTYRIILVGDTMTGKTSIIERFVKGVFTDSKTSTIGVGNCSLTVNVNGVDVLLQIWDTAGQEQYRSMIPSYYRGAHGAVFVFSLTDPDSLEHIPNWIEDFSIYCPRGEYVVAGNKSDLVEIDALEKEIFSKVQQYGFTFMRTSAKEDIGISELFNVLVEMIMNHKDEGEDAIIVKQQGDSTPKSSCC